MTNQPPSDPQGPTNPEGITEQDIAEIIEGVQAINSHDSIHVDTEDLIRIHLTKGTELGKILVKWHRKVKSEGLVDNEAKVELFINLPEIRNLEGSSLEYFVDKDVDKLGLSLGKEVFLDDAEFTTGIDSEGAKLLGNSLDPKDPEAVALAKAMNFVKDEFQVEDLTMVQTIRFIERGQVFGRDYVGRLRAEKEGVKLDEYDPYEQAQIMLKEMANLPLVRELKICNVTVDEAITELEELSAKGLEIVKAYIEVLKLNKNVGEYSPFEASDPFEDEMDKLISVLSDLNPDSEYRGKPVSETIDDLKARNAAGMKLFRLHLQIIVKRGVKI